VPLAQGHARWPVRQFVVRTGTDHPSIVESIRAAAAAIDPRQPLQDFITLDALAAQSIEEERFYAVIAGAFAAIAVVLALAGLYGVVAFAVRQRDREVGIRMALGATPGVVSRMVLADGMRPVVAGLVLGCLGAMAGARIIRGLLHGVHELDPISYLSATAAFAAVAALACLIPARRASGIDPVRTLNQG
jgi:putative ABC transport system permease protein